MSVAYATIQYITLENEEGYDVDSVQASCTIGETEAYGTHERSIKRALAELSQNCSCGASFHKEEGDKYWHDIYPMDISLEQACCNA